MRTPHRWLATAFAVICTCSLFTATSFATDVDGGADCSKQSVDFGDAPESALAYPGVAGAFPTCLFGGPIGTQTTACPAISTAPGFAGFVRHVRPAGSISYWLGCFPNIGGLDHETNGKMNDSGAALSSCVDIPVDCFETAFTLTFGQDECYGSTDAGVAAAISFAVCTPSSVTFNVYSCATFNRQVYLNILVDWNKDGDWSDSFLCGANCSYEWAVKNVPIVIGPGCTAITSPLFLSGPNETDGWMRITINDSPVNDDFPWAGSATVTPGQSLVNGETEDYPITVGDGGTCPDWEDWGDAPEESFAYPGVPGCFPTCAFFGGPGDMELFCAAISTPPGPTGHVQHISTAADPNKFWLGCGDGTAANPGVDSEPNGKMNSTGAAISVCDQLTPIDCVEPAFVMLFGQDECTADGVDAGVNAPIAFTTCTSSTVSFDATNCEATTIQVYLNILVDWNHDGDWNDNFDCGGGPVPVCAYEWAVKNVLIALPPGCTPQVSPTFISGPFATDGWLRITLTPAPVGDSYPWNGSLLAGGGTGFFRGGETEDYPVRIGGHGDPCPDWEDWGDAPEESFAYPGVPGCFPTCSFFGGPGDMELACAPISTPPGPTGHVTHLSPATDPTKFWLGCGIPGIDSESNGKMNDTGGPISDCATGTPIDCVQGAFGMLFGQDECTADGVDAGINAPIAFGTCASSTVAFDAFNCETNTVDAYLNILVDWNHDGDWNDNFECPGGPTFVCAYEWAVKNVPIVLPPGCSPQISPAFLSGPFNTDGWLRITLTEAPVGDSYPWNGSLLVGGGTGSFQGGETEDYPVRIGQPQDSCEVGYIDYGDAPEGIPAYSSGLIGLFPTCLAPSIPAAQQLECGVPISTPPATTGYVAHLATPSDADHFWLGCGGALAGPFAAIDGEADGKVNIGGPAGSPSFCDDAVLVDCAEAPIGPTFGQDECYGDLDAGLAGPYSFAACTTQAVTFKVYNCSDHNVVAHVNILVDWNQDGDWNDNVSVLCSEAICAYEWGVKNLVVTLVPGCNTITTPAFATGPKAGTAWMRLSISSDPAPDDFPWNGSASLAGGTLKGGETEDYGVLITPMTTGVDDHPSQSGSLWFGAPSPNPGMDNTTLRYSLVREAEVEMSVYDLAGRKLVSLARGRQDAGLHTIQWNFRDASGKEVAPGNYIVKLRVGDAVLTRRAIRVR